MELRTDRVVTEQAEEPASVVSLDSLVEDRNAHVEAAQAGSVAFAQAIEASCAQDMQRLTDRASEHATAAAAARAKLLASTTALDEQRARLAERLREQRVAAFAEAV